MPALDVVGAQNPAPPPIGGANLRIKNLGGTDDGRVFFAPCIPPLGADREVMIFTGDTLFFCFAAASATLAAADAFLFLPTRRIAVFVTSVNFRVA